MIWVMSGSRTALAGVLRRDPRRCRRRPGRRRRRSRHHDDREAEDERRVHHRRFDLAPQRVELLELEGDPVERLLEAAGALSRADHRAVEAVEDRRVALHRLVQRAAGLDVGAHPAMRVADLSSSVWSSSVYRDRSIGMPEATRVANWREKTARSRMLTLWKRLKRPSMLDRLALLGDVEDDQAALAQLLGDLRLGLGLELAAARRRRRGRWPGRRRCSRRPSASPPGCRRGRRRRRAAAGAERPAVPGVPAGAACGITGAARRAAASAPRARRRAARRASG